MSLDIDDDDGCNCHCGDSEKLLAHFARLIAMVDFALLLHLLLVEAAALDRLLLALLALDGVSCDDIDQRRPHVRFASAARCLVDAIGDALGALECATQLDVVERLERRRFGLHSARLGRLAARLHCAIRFVEKDASSRGEFGRVGGDRQCCLQRGRLVAADGALRLVGDGHDCGGIDHRRAISATVDCDGDWQPCEIVAEPGEAVVVIARGTRLHARCGAANAAAYSDVPIARRRIDGEQLEVDEQLLKSSRATEQFGGGGGGVVVVEQFSGDFRPIGGAQCARHVQRVFSGNAVDVVVG